MGLFTDSERGLRLKNSLNQIRDDTHIYCPETGLMVPMKGFFSEFEDIDEFDGSRLKVTDRYIDYCCSVEHSFNDIKKCFIRIEDLCNGVRWFKVRETLKRYPYVRLKLRDTNEDPTRHKRNNFIKQRVPSKGRIRNPSPYEYQ